MKKISLLLLLTTSFYSLAMTSIVDESTEHAPLPMVMHNNNNDTCLKKCFPGGAFPNEESFNCTEQATTVGCMSHGMVRVGHAIVCSPLILVGCVLLSCDDCAEFCCDCLC